MDLRCKRSNCTSIRAGNWVATLRRDSPRGTMPLSESAFEDPLMNPNFWRHLLCLDDRNRLSIQL